jgi:hypothetical protein
MNPVRSPGKQGIYIEGGGRVWTPPPKPRGRGVVQTTPYHLDMSGGPVIKAWGTLKALSWRLNARRGRYYGNVKFLFRVFITVYYRILRILRSFITDITGFSKRILLTPNKDTKKASKLSHLRNPWKNRADFLRILRSITEIAITEYYGP